MDSDKITGKAKETIGKAEVGVGEAIGDGQMDASGHVRQAAGAAQESFGGAKDAFNTAADAAEPMMRTLEEQVKANPLIALAIAAIAGYVIALLTSASS